MHSSPHRCYIESILKLLRRVCPGDQGDWRYANANHTRLIAYSNAQKCDHMRSRSCQFAANTAKVWFMCNMVKCGSCWKQLQLCLWKHERNSEYDFGVTLHSPQAGTATDCNRLFDLHSHIWLIASTLAVLQKNLQNWHQAPLPTPDSIVWVVVTCASLACSTSLTVIIVRGSALGSGTMRWSTFVWVQGAAMDLGRSGKQPSRISEIAEIAEISEILQVSKIPETPEIAEIAGISAISEV